MSIWVIILTVIAVWFVAGFLLAFLMGRVLSLNERWERWYGRR